jgi:hypothetical protein
MGQIMATKEMFDSAVRSAGDQAGVFEYDVDVGYFYLYVMNSKEGQKVVSAIRVLTGTPDFGEEDIAIRWNTTESQVGLFIRGQLWAVFDSRTGDKYGGDYRANAKPLVPLEIIATFASQ